MTTRAAMQRIACVIIVGGCGGFVFANSAYIYQGSFNFAIPSLGEPESKYGKGSMNDAILEVTDHHIIRDVDLAITLTHESLFDLQILLQSPAGTNAVLNLAGNTAFIVRDKNNRLIAVGGSGTLTFDDESDIPIQKAIAPFFRTFQPVDSLSLFDSEDTYGKWRLKVYDAFYASTGTLNGLKLTITTPEPSSAILFTLAAGFALFSKPR